MLPIKTVYYGRRGRILKTNRSMDANRAVGTCVLHMQSRLLAERTCLTDDESDLLNETMHEMRITARAYGVRLANDDRAARLEAALICYILESRK